jgi:S-adenosylmethionine synthetase
MARYIAKNVVAAGFAKKCLIQISYAIGCAHPISVHVDTSGTGVFSDERLSQIIQETFDLRPKAIIQQLDLLKPRYKKSATY